MYKVLFVLACIPVTPIVMGSVALYRYLGRRNGSSARAAVAAGIANRLSGEGTAVS